MTSVWDAALGMALAAAAAGGPSPSPSLPPCVERAPCVYVDPDPAAVREVGTTFVFRGQGWRPRRRASVRFSGFCPPGTYCDHVGMRERRLRVDGRGRFEFRIRYAGRSRGAAVAGIPRGTRFTQRRVERDAMPTPPPSTPAERAEAARLAGASRRALRALQAREGAVRRAHRRHERSVTRCAALRAADRDERTGRVGLVLTRLGYEQAVFGTVRAELEAFAVVLERAPLADPVLRAGADAWIAAIRRPRPWPSPDACTVMRRWAATGYAADRRPIDPDAVQSLGFEVGESPALGAARARMRELGAGRAAARRFGGGLVAPEDEQAFFG